MPNYANPILTGGGPSQQSIFEESTDQRHEIGTRGVLPDGRVYYYSANQTTALVAGKATKMNQVSVDFDDLATNTVLINATTINVTPVGTATYSENELAGGFVSINSGTTGAGHQYKIKSHPVTVAATAFDIEIYDKVRVAFNADTTATVVPNPWSDCVVSAAATAEFINGVPPLDVTVGTAAAPYYFWNQTWGVATLLIDTGSTPAIGDGVTSGGAVAGAVDTAAGVMGVVGKTLYTGVAADYGQFFLTIAP